MKEQPMEGLLESLKHDNLVSLRRILGSGFDIATPILVGEEYDISEPDETNLLFYAIRTNATIEAIEILIEFGFDIAYFDENGISALDTAIKYKRYDVIRLCIQSGVELEHSRRRSGITPLMLTSCFGDMQSAKLLIDHGVNLDTQDKSGMRARDYARKLGQKKFEDFLAQKGASYGVYRE
jgi:uncharacterized protein